MMTIDRTTEIRELFRLSVEELVQASKGRLVVKDSLPELYEYLAEEMCWEFEKASARNGPTAFIMPVGPTQPYKAMADLINRRRLSLQRCHFFFMDEYCRDDGSLIAPDHPLSFRGKIDGLFFDLVDPGLLMPPEQRIFPTPENLSELPEMIARAGGIEVCYGGIGIHGHIAFNEPGPDVLNSGPRIVQLNEFTRTVDAVRHGLGGNLINFPRQAITLGLRDCLGARRLLLMTRNEHPGMDWANTALRLAVLGRPGDDYPATHIRNHANCTVATDRATATAPRVII